MYVDDDASPLWYDATHVRTIQEGVDNASAGDMIFVYTGLYTENIRINKSVILRGENQNSTIIDGNETGTVIRVFANGVTITGFTVQHAKSNYQGIYLSSSDYCTISENTIIHNKGDGIQLRSSEKNIVSDNFIGYNRRGITFEPFSNDNIISGNCIHQNQYYSGTYGIVVTLSRNNTISSNSFIDNTLYLSSSYQSIVINNTFTSKGIHLASESASDYFSTTIENNIVNGKEIRYYKSEHDLILPDNTGQVILLACTNITVKNLIFSDVDVPVHLVLSTDCTISKNMITGAKNGILLYDYCRNNTIFENTITHNIQGIVIEFWSPEKNKIIGNIIQDNDENGIALYDSTKSVIQGNSIERNSNGIYLEPEYGSCSNNSIVQNLIRENRNDGIRLFNADHNLLQWNCIENNHYGIFLLGSEANIIIENNIWYNEKGIYSGSSSYGNLIYHDNFINNTQNAVDSGNNIWENMLLQEGNYWSDFEENLGYPDCYFIPEGMNSDDCPLLNPYESVEILPDEYSILYGKYLSGKLSDLYDSDDQRLMINAALTSMKTGSPVWVEIQGRALIQNPPWLKFTLESKVNSRNIEQTINLYNYEQQHWDKMDARPATTTDQVVEIILHENPSQYINQTTRAIKAQIQWKSTGPTPFFPWQVSIDQVIWNLSPFTN